MAHQPEVSYPENTEINFPEGQFDKEIETKCLYQADATGQEYIRPTEKNTTLTVQI